MMSSSSSSKAIYEASLVEEIYQLRKYIQQAMTSFSVSPTLGSRSKSRTHNFGEHGSELYDQNSQLMCCLLLFCWRLLLWEKCESQAKGFLPFIILLAALCSSGQTVKGSEVLKGSAVALLLMVLRWVHCSHVLLLLVLR